MNPFPRLGHHPDEDPVQSFLNSLRDEGVRVRRRGTRVYLEFPAPLGQCVPTLLRLGIASQQSLVRRYQIDDETKLQLELTQAPRTELPETLDFDNVDDERHYRHAPAFLSLLEHHGYAPQQEGLELRVNFPVESPLSHAYRLAELTRTALDHGLVIATINGSESPEFFCVIMTLDQARVQPPFYKVVSSAEDYLVLAPEIERHPLPWPQMGNPEALRELLVAHSLLYYDENGPGSALSLRQHLLQSSVRGQLNQYKRAVKERDDKTIQKLWLDVFDLEIDLALAFPEEHVILSLTEPDGVRHGLYLLERASLQELLP